MFSRSGPIPTGKSSTFEVRWDGFRTLVSTIDGLRGRSRRGWDMTPRLPELRWLPAGLVLDGELVALCAARTTRGDGGRRTRSTAATHQAPPTGGRNEIRRLFEAGRSIEEIAAAAGVRCEVVLAIVSPR